jgi:hypothetical protein
VELRDIDDDNDVDEEETEEDYNNDFIITTGHEKDLNLKDVQRHQKPNNNSSTKLPPLYLDEDILNDSLSFSSSPTNTSCSIKQASPSGEPQQQAQSSKPLSTCSEYTTMSTAATSNITNDFQNIKPLTSNKFVCLKFNFNNPSDDPRVEANQVGQRQSMQFASASASSTNKLPPSSSSQFAASKPVVNLSRFHSFRLNHNPNLEKLKKALNEGCTSLENDVEPNQENSDLNATVHSVCLF